MINFVYDFKNEQTYLPNLVKDTTLVPKSTEWYDLALKTPFSQENRLVKYMRLDNAPHREMLSTELPLDQIGHYMVNLNFFDIDIDYFELMEKRSRKMLRNKRLVFVFYYSEGDWLDDGIADHINDLCIRHNISREYVKFVCANALAPTYGNSFVYFPDDELYYRYLHIHKKDYVTEVNMQPRSKKFTFLNRIDKPWRKAFAASLWQHGLQNDSYFSYQDKQYTTSHDPFDIRDDDPMEWCDYWNDVDRLVAQFDLYTPLSCDDMTDDEHNNHSIIHKPFFDDAYWNFVTETHYTDDTIFLTEKTFKCILNLQPFVIIGNPGSLMVLHDLGYKTFDDYIFEDYDSVENGEKRMHSCFTECYKLATYDDNAHRKVMRELKPLLEYNQRVFLASKLGRINTLVKELQV